MKKFFEKLSRTIGFTPNEGKIVFFLVGALLVGGILKLSGVSNSKPPRMDYSTSDSEYAQKTRMLQSSLAAQDSTDSVTPEQNEGEGFNTEAKPPPPSRPIDLNTATKDQLLTLPGVGEATAERIILYRTELGEFTSLDQLLHIKGIGEKKLDQLRPYITLEK